MKNGFEMVGTSSSITFVSFFAFVITCSGEREEMRSKQTLQLSSFGRRCDL